MKRKIIEINEELCDGCGKCIPNCPEGAIQIIDKKARLVSDIFCDGLGACLGHCPKGAIKTIERESEPYDEDKVMNNITKKGRNTIKAHLEHLKNHNEASLLSQAIAYLSRNNIENPLDEKKEKSQHKTFCACPGSVEIDLLSENKEKSKFEIIEKDNSKSSELRQWPIQLALISENSSFFKNSDLLISADCVGFSDPNFHNNLLKNKAMITCCPKLDEVDYEKIKSVILLNDIKSITVAIMEVPCCSKLYRMVENILKETKKNIPLKQIIVKMNGNYLAE